MLCLLDTYSPCPEGTSILLAGKVVHINHSLTVYILAEISVIIQRSHMEEIIWKLKERERVHKVRENGSTKHLK